MIDVDNSTLETNFPDNQIFYFYKDFRGYTESKNKIYTLENVLYDTLVC